MGLLCESDMTEANLAQHILQGSGDTESSQEYEEGPQRKEDQPNKANK